MTCLARLKLAAFATIFALVSGPMRAETLEIQPVTDGVWALVGPMEQRSAENLANNATFGLVVTRDGAVLVDPGGSWNGAARIHEAIKSLTDLPVKFVIDTGGQDHRWMGNGYWQEQGARIIASRDAVNDQKARQVDEMAALSNFLKDQLAGTEPKIADLIFDDRFAFDLGGVSFQVIHAGGAHTPGDSFVWVESKDTVFTGDIVYVERILGVGDQSNVKSWIDTYETMAALNPAHVVPGHGHATTLAQAKAETYDYLVNLRSRIGALIEAGGDIIDAPKIDQSAYTHLLQFDSLAGRNAQTTYEQMEWE